MTCDSESPGDDRDSLRRLRLQKLSNRCLTGLAIGVGVVCIVLSIKNHTDHARAADAAQQWSVTHSSASLADRISPIVAPAVNVFESRDADLESTRLHNALVAFAGALPGSRHDDTKLASLRDKMSLIVGQLETRVREVLAQYKQGNSLAAAQRLASLQRVYDLAWQQTAQYSAAKARQQHAHLLGVQSDIITRQRWCWCLSGIAAALWLLSARRPARPARQLADHPANQDVHPILEQTTDSIVGVSGDGTICFANAAATERWGSADGRIVGCPLNSILDLSSCTDVHDAQEFVTQSMHLPIEIGHADDIDHPPCSVRGFSRGTVGDALLLIQESPPQPHIQMDSELGRILEESLSEVYLFDAANLRFVQVNRGGRENLGFTLDELRDRTPLDLKPEFDHEEFIKILDALKAGERQRAVFKTTHRRQDGSLYRVESHLQMATFGGDPVYVANVLDITEREQSEYALRVSQERFDLAITGTSDGIWDWNVLTGEVFFSPRFLELLEHSEDDPLEATFEAWQTLIHADDLDDASRVTNRHLNGQGPLDIAYRLRTQSGHYRWFRVRGQAIWNAAGQATRVAGSLTDITKQREDQDALARADLQKQAVLDAASEVSIIATNASGMITLFNRGAEKLLGHPAVEMIGKRNLTSIHRAEELNTRADELTSEMGVDVDPFGVLISLPQRYGHEEREWTYVARNGEQRTVHQAVTCVRDPSGAINGYLAVAIDITSRKAAERELKKLALVAAKTDNAVVITDAEGRIDWVNTGFCKLTEFTLEEVIGKKPGELLQGAETDPSTVEQMRSARQQGRSFEGEIFNYTKSGRGYWLAISITPIRDQRGELSGFIAVEMDITQRKLAEVELQKAKETAEAANQAKSQFLANMSHEIRTPMNGIIAMTDLALDTELSEVQRDYLDTVKTSTESLLTIINDILDFSKIEAGKLDIENIPFEVRPLISDTLKTLSVRADQKGLQLDWQVDEDVPTRLIGDPHRLRQVLVNLAGNSVKFTESGTIRVQVETASIVNEAIQLRFHVSDTGIGIAEDKLSHIFDAFSQADASMTRTFGGTGLGLSISAKLVELMDGRLSVSSQLGSGSTFSFTARFSPTDHDDQTSPPLEDVDASTNSVPARALKLLLVEDNQVNQKVARAILSKSGHAIQVANNGEEAVRAVANEDFDIVLMDVQMPVMDGVSATAAIRQAEAGTSRHTVIIAMTAHAMRGDRQRFLDAGMNDYLAKPITAQQLNDMIRRHSPVSDEKHTGASSGDPRSTVAGGTTIFNHARALSLADEDDELLRELVQDLLAARDDILIDLRVAIDRGDCGRLVEVAHSAKGALAQIGAENARDAFAELEQLGRKQDLAAACDAGDRAKSALDELENVLQAALL